MDNAYDGTRGLGGALGSTASTGCRFFVPFNGWFVTTFLGSWTGRLVSPARRRRSAGSGCWLPGYLLAPLLSCLVLPATLRPAFDIRCWAGTGSSVSSLVPGSLVSTRTARRNLRFMRYNVCCGFGLGGHLDGRWFLTTGWFVLPAFYLRLCHYAQYNVPCMRCMCRGRISPFRGCSLSAGLGGGDVCRRRAALLPHSFVTARVCYAWRPSADGLFWCSFSSRHCPLPLFIYVARAFSPISPTITYIVPLSLPRCLPLRTLPYCFLPPPLRTVTAVAAYIQTACCYFRTFTLFTFMYLLLPHDRMAPWFGTLRRWFCRTRG